MNYNYNYLFNKKNIPNGGNNNIFLRSQNRQILKPIQLQNNKNYILIRQLQLHRKNQIQQQNQLRQLQLQRQNQIQQLQIQQQNITNSKNIHKYKQNLIPRVRSNQTLSKKVYIISNIVGGGSKKYLDDIKNHYIDVKFITIKDKEDLYNFVFKPVDIIFLQHIILTNILPNDILNLKNKYNFKLIISIHDFCWFTNLKYDQRNPDKYYENIYLRDNINIDESIIRLLNSAELVIHPSNFTLNQYSKYFSINNCIVYNHNDIVIKNDTKNIPIIHNKIINIAHFQSLSEYKGSNNVLLLKSKYKFYKGYKINIFTDINYNEDNWNIQMLRYNLHGLLHLNMYGETYSYALSKSINSGLPILYNNIGCFKERLSVENKHHIKVIDNEAEYTNYYKLFKNFEKWLDYIIENNGKYTLSCNDTTIKYNEFYNFIFNDSYEENMSSNIHKKIKPFAIYFPQFHSIEENNNIFYYGMTDITNLDALNSGLKNKLDSPSITELNLNNILDYMLTNEDIINRQISIAKNYCIYGFAVYYYWFSQNSITNRNTLMENSYNLFFKNKIDGFKIFFIWDNEDWSNNENIVNNITNIYDVDNFNKNINNLIDYFKHENYYKINNKPVFYIHHPYLIPENDLQLFEVLLNKKCIDNGFNGVVLYLNNMTKKNENFNNYGFHPNYKTTPELDYSKYINQKLDDQSNCIFFDFDNSARLYIPNKLQLVNKIFNNDIYNQNTFINKVLKNYSNSETIDENKNNILLINSWNEWGQNMAIEPGNLTHYKYLSLIKANLLSYCVGNQ